MIVLREPAYSKHALHKNPSHVPLRMDIWKMAHEYGLDIIFIVAMYYNLYTTYNLLNNVHIPSLNSVIKWG